MRCARRRSAKHDGTSRPSDYQLQILTSEINRECPLVYILSVVLYHSRAEKFPLRSFFLPFLSRFLMFSVHVLIMSSETARLTISRKALFVLQHNRDAFCNMLAQSQTFFLSSALSLLADDCELLHKLILIPFGCL